MDVAPPAKAAETANGFRPDRSVMRYLRWQQIHFTGTGIVEMLTESGDDGYVDRELGFDDAGRVVHRKPSADFPVGDFGYFEEALGWVDSVLALGSAEEIDQAAFERAWAQPDFPPPRSPGLVERLLGRLRRGRPGDGGK